MNIKEILKSQKFKKIRPMKYLKQQNKKKY